MADLQLGPDSIERLAAKVEQFGAQLDDEDRALLAAVFALAGQAVEQRLQNEQQSQAQVRGYTLQQVALRVDRSALSGSLADTFRSAFTPGRPRGLGLSPFATTPIPIP
jgi:hypothetical protein